MIISRTTYTIILEPSIARSICLISPSPRSGTFPLGTYYHILSIYATIIYINAIARNILPANKIGSVSLSPRGTSPISELAHHHPEQEKASRSILQRGFFASKDGSGGPIRTDDLWVMSPTSYQAAPPRNVNQYYTEPAGICKTKLKLKPGIRIGIQLRR